MDKEVLENYVRGERARGIADAAIRAELLLRGWKKEDVLIAVPEEKQPAMFTLGAFVIGQSEKVALRALLLGFMLFLFSTATLFNGGAGRNFKEDTFVFALFSLTHILNALAAFFLFHSIWSLSRSVWFRVWIGILSFIVAMFAILSLTHFLSIALGSDFFDVIQRALLGDDYLPFLIYFGLLPLQAIVFLLLMISLWILMFVRRRANKSIVPLRVHFATTALFFLMALLALGDVYLVIERFQ
jgi:hypothetical protein